MLDYIIENLKQLLGASYDNVVVVPFCNGFEISIGNLLAYSLMFFFVFWIILFIKKIIDSFITMFR